LVDKKAISFEKHTEERKTHVHTDNKKLGIYKNPMPQHNTSIQLMQEHTVKGVGISKPQSDKQQSKASTNGGTKLSRAIIW